MGGATSRAKHWAELEERGADWGPALLGFVYRILGRPACLALVAPVIVYFYVAGARQRRASLDYLRRVARARGETRIPGHGAALRHFFSFGESLIDKYSAWVGHIDRRDVAAIDGGVFDEMRRDPGGAIILSAHFGAAEIIRAIASRDQRRRVNIVIHTRNARRYNKLIQRFAPQSQVAVMEAADFNIGAAMELSAAVERGEWIVMMGDRKPVTGEGRTIAVDFLGGPALFPQGPFILAGALRCPVYLLFCYKESGRHKVHFSTLSRGVQLSKRGRMAELREVVERYARTLETLVKAAPDQWFNFYDFWAPAQPSRASGKVAEGAT